MPIVNSRNPVNCLPVHEIPFCHSMGNVRLSQRGHHLTEGHLSFLSLQDGEDGDVV